MMHLQNTGSIAAPSAESLEPRRLLAAVSWDGGGDGVNWMDPLNWSGNVLPGEFDDVAIDAPTANPHIQVVDAIVRIASLTSMERVTLAGGSIDASGNVTIGASGQFRLGDASLSPDGRGWLFVDGDLLGSGRIEITRLDSGIFAGNSTIEAGIEIAMMTTGRGFVRGGNLTNHARMDSSFPGGELAVGGVPDSSGFTNRYFNHGALTASNGGRLLVCGIWTTTTPIQVADADLEFQGSYSASDVSFVQRSGTGQMLLNGDIRLHSGALALSSATGSATLGGFLIGPGTVTTAPGTQLNCRGGTLWDVTLDGKVALQQFATRTRGTIAMTGTATLVGEGGSLTPDGGWTLNIQAADGARLSNASINGSVTVSEADAALWIENGLSLATIRLTGDGAKAIANGSQSWNAVTILHHSATASSLLIRNTPGSGVPTVLTLAGGTIRGGRGSIADDPANDQPAQLVNGTIRADVPGTTLTVNLPGGRSQSAGASEATAGAALHFAGPFTQTGGSTILNGGTITSAAPLNIQGGLLVVRSGVYDFQPAAYVDPAGMNVQVDGTGVLNFTASQTLKSLTVKIGARANVTPGGDKVLRLNTLDLNRTALQGGGINAGKLNLADNHLLIDYTGATPYADIFAYAASGRDSGVGLVSDPGDGDMALAVVDNALYGATDFSGIEIDDTTIIAKRTFYGDANLDGAVTSDDYVAVDVNLGMNPGTSQWFQGDFDFNGHVTSDDYVAIDVNLGKGSTAPSAVGEEPESLVTSVEQAAQSSHKTSHTKKLRPGSKDGPARGR